MKSKKSIYLLLPLVLGIWGLVGYRVYKMTRPDNSFALNPVYKDRDSNEFNYQQRISLLLQYADPFLKEIPDATSEQVQNEFAALFTTNPAPEKPKLVWPEISFKGVLSGNERRLAVLEVDKKRYLAATGDSILQLQVMKLYPDSIILEYNHEIKCFSK